MDAGLGAAVVGAKLVKSAYSAWKAFSSSNQVPVTHGGVVYKAGDDINVVNHNYAQRPAAYNNNAIIVRSPMPWNYNYGRLISHKRVT